MAERIPRPRSRMLLNQRLHVLRQVLKRGNFRTQLLDVVVL